MIVQAIGLLDDLDKELNTYAMRVREWYGWHFPEMTRVVTDNIQYALAVRFSARAHGAAPPMLCLWRAPSAVCPPCSVAPEAFCKSRARRRCSSSANMYES